MGNSSIYKVWILPIALLDQWIRLVGKCYEKSLTSQIWEVPCKSSLRPIWTF
jgi:hypothetical protein